MENEIQLTFLSLIIGLIYALKVDLCLFFKLKWLLPLTSLSLIVFYLIIAQKINEGIFSFYQIIFIILGIVIYEKVYHIYLLKFLKRVWYNKIKEKSKAKGVKRDEES